MQTILAKIVGSITFQMYFFKLRRMSEIKMGDVHFFRKTFKIGGSSHPDQSVSLARFLGRDFSKGKGFDPPSRMNT